MTVSEQLLKGQNALVTGVKSGIGEATVRAPDW
jgi:NAD(P)-dependent dehydrogenase (short-subunit alcohol dehydrogenase family)